MQGPPKDEKRAVSEDKMFVWNTKALLHKLEVLLGPQSLDESLLIHDVRILAKDVEEFLDKWWSVPSGLGPDAIKKKSG